MTSPARFAISVLAVLLGHVRIASSTGATQPCLITVQASYCPTGMVCVNQVCVQTNPVPPNPVPPNPVPPNPVPPNPVPPNPVPPNPVPPNPVPPNPVPPPIVINPLPQPPAPRPQPQPQPSQGCVDKNAPGRTSDCPGLTYLCNHPLYRPLMRDQCARACGFCG